MSVKKLYSYEVIKGTSIHKAEHYRISDPEDNRIGTCYLPENAKRIVDALNAMIDLQKPGDGAGHTALNIPWRHDRLESSSFNTIRSDDSPPTLIIATGMYPPIAEHIVRLHNQSLE